MCSGNDINAGESGGGDGSVAGKFFCSQESGIWGAAPSVLMKRQK